MWQYNNELYHYGRLGMRWGQHLFNTRDRYQNRLSRYQQQSNKYASILARPKNAKQMAKAAKYKAQWQKAEGKARRARMRREAGRSISRRQSNKIMRAESLKSKMNKYEGYNSKYVAKKSKADYNVIKYQKKIERINKRIKIWEMNSGTVNVGKNYLNQKRKPI